MPRNGKEGILFSFIMSAIMIYVMAALNYGVRTGDVGTAAWSYAFFNWPLAYVIGMICDLCICTPSSRAIMNRFCAQTDRAVCKGITVKFLMVVLMTVFMTIFGAIMAFGPSADAVVGFFSMFPYNFTIALPIQMLIVAPLSGVIVHAVGDKAGWNREARQRTPKLGVETVADVMQKDVYTVSDTATVRDAVRVMLDRNISGVPIVNETGAVVGFVSDSDVLRRFAQDNLPVSDISTLITGMARGEFPELSHAQLLERNVMGIATDKVTTVDIDASIAEVCQMFGYQRYKKLPVVDGGRLVGVINRGHLTRRSFETCLENGQHA